MISIDELRLRILALEGRALELSDDEIDTMHSTELATLLSEFASSVLMRPPPRERAFILWLKDNDPAVAADLWGDEEPTVSLVFIEAFKHHDRGFLICELEHCDNYFFTTRHIKHPALEALPAILDRAASGEQLAIGEALLFEILQHPIDIWHFCYKYKIPIERGKSIVAELTKQNWLVHLTAREDLTKYIEN